MVDTALQELPPASQLSIRGKKSPGVGHLARSVLQLLTVPAAIVAAWVVGSALLPHAIPTVQASARSLLEGYRAGWFLFDLRETMVVAALAFAITAAGGVTAGVLLGLNRFWGDVLEPVLLWIYSIPKVVFYPLIMLIFGITFEARAAFAVLNGILPVILIIFVAVRSVPAIYLKVGTIYGLGRAGKFFGIVLPEVLPGVIRALRYGFSLSYLGVIIAEMFAAREGLGHRLIQSIALVRFSRVFAIAVTLAAIGLLVNAGFLLIARLVEAKRAEAA